MTIIDGNLVSQQIKSEIKEQVDAMLRDGKKRPHLAAILVGSDGASQTYVGHKVKSCEQVGFASTLLRFDADISEESLIQEIQSLNANDEIDGFIVQLPLPKHINADTILLHIDPRKDVDGFHPVNFGRMCLNLPAYIPATPMGIMTLLKRYKIETAGKHCVVIGRSNIVGRPMSVLMSQAGIDCTVTLCHSKTPDLVAECKRADIIIAALGKPGFVTAAMVKPGAVLIDVGITRVVDESKKTGYRICGDVDYDAVKDLCSYITPVPGGVGPMTVVSLLLNTLNAAEQKIYA